MERVVTYRPIRRPSDMWIPPLLEEYRRLALGVEPVSLVIDPESKGSEFHCVKNAESRYFVVCQSGSDYAQLLSAIAWLRNGPKIADVTEEQFEALSRVQVRLEVRDVRLPFPSLLVNMPAGKMHRYVIVGHHEAHVKGSQDRVPLIIAVSVSHDNTQDIVTIARQREGEYIEGTLGKFVEDKRLPNWVSPDEAAETHASLRVAINMALAMTNYGYQASYLFPAEVERERKFVLKGNRPARDGRTAKDRLTEQPMMVSLERGVELCHREGSHEAGEPTGREMPFHWRRGHWHKVRCGVGKAETRLVFYRPTMVRADLFGGNQMDTTTTYHK